MSKALDRLTRLIKTETADMENAEYAELLHELAGWAESTAGMLEYETLDTEDYE